MGSTKALRVGCALGGVPTAIISYIGWEVLNLMCIPGGVNSWDDAFDDAFDDNVLPANLLLRWRVNIEQRVSGTSC